MALDLRVLATLVAVVDCGSVVGASEARGYSPAAVSRQLSSLQQRLGVRLFAPSGRSIRPLPPALELAAIARPLLEAAARAEREIRRVGATRAGVAADEPTGPVRSA